MKMLLYFMVVIMNAPLPIPRKTTANGKIQQREATNAETTLTIPDFMPDIHILIFLLKKLHVKKRYSPLQYAKNRWLGDVELKLIENKISKHLSKWLSTRKS